MPSVSQLTGGHGPSMSGIKEQKLNEIVNAIGCCSYKTMKDLGFAMGFQKVDIDQYVASNHHNGTVSLRGITDMMFAWKRNICPANQMRLLRKALIKAKLIEIADKFLPKNETVTQLEKTVTTLQTSATQTVGLNTAAAQKGQTLSVELLCKKCDRVTAKITNVINTKRSDRAKRSKVRNIMGRECLVQLMESYNEDDFANRNDVITLTTADVELGDTVYPGSGGYEGYKEHRCTRCKGCSEQVGWYLTPTDENAAPFYVLRLKNLIHDSCQKQSVELLCKKCNRVTAKITDVINTKRSEDAESSKVRNIMGRECLVQLMGAELNEVFDNRYDVITLTDADVKLSDTITKFGGYEGYKEYRGTRCNGCSQQVGWYNIPTDCRLAPFHELWLQRLIHDTYDSDNSLNTFFAQNPEE